MRNFEPRDIEKAEAEMWVRLRLSAIESYGHHLDGYIEEAVREICLIIYRYKDRWVSPSSFGFQSNNLMYAEILAVMSDLEGKIKDALETLATLDDEEVSEERRDAMHSTLRESLDKWERETEALATCGLLTGIDTAEALAAAVVLSEDDPWHSDLFRDGREEALRYGSSNDIIYDGGVSYGVGHSNIGGNILLMTGTAYLTNVFGDKQLAGHPDAKEFLSVTADAKACDNCVDEERRGWQPIANYAGPWHPNCRCHFYFR